MATECPNCGGKKKLLIHCGHPDCFWFSCKYCFAISDGDNFFIDNPATRSK